MKINNTQTNTNFGALRFAPKAYSRLTNTLSQMNPAEKTAAEVKIFNMLKNCFSDVKKDIYIHSFETKKDIHFQLSPSKSQLGALFEHNFIDFAPKMLKVEKSKTTPAQMVDSIVKFVSDINENREPVKLAVSFKR